MNQAFGMETFSVSCQNVGGWWGVPGPSLGTEKVNNCLVEKRRSRMRDGYSPRKIIGANQRLSNFEKGELHKKIDDERRGVHKFPVFAKVLRIGIKILILIG